MHARHGMPLHLAIEYHIRMTKDVQAWTNQCGAQVPRLPDTLWHLRSRAVRRAAWHVLQMPWGDEEQPDIEPDLSGTGGRRETLHPARGNIRQANQLCASADNH